MSSAMRITGIRLKNYRQFRDFNLDLTDPKTKEPLDKVCFIGSNGTGKTTLLALIAEFLEAGGHRIPSDLNQMICYQISQGKDEFFILYDHARNMNWSGDSSRPYVLSVRISETNEWKNLWKPQVDHTNDQKFNNFLIQRNLARRDNDVLEKFLMSNNASDLAIYASPDGSSLLKSSSSGLPSTNLDKALKLFDNLPAYHESSFSRLEAFWNFLIYQIKKRERDYLQFLDSQDAQNLQVHEAKRQFDLTYPEILKQLAEQWNLILDQAGLEFDIINAQIPVQLSENLQAFIKLQSSDTQVPYNLLSTGIRNFIFRFGHIFTLYFNRQIERGFLLLDEPEASLFPDLLHDIIARYESIIHNTQFFAATHSPIVAAQFRPEERFILEFDETGAVNWRRGVSPEGDDPNDLLMNDFGIRSLYRDKGNKEYKRFLSLRQQILITDDKNEKIRLLDEYAKIGNAYNFPTNDAISTKIN